MRRAALLFFSVVALVGASGAALAQAEDREIAKHRALERKTFTDTEIFDGFFKVSFGAEMQIAGRVDRIRKYDVPVRVHIENRAKPDRSAQIASVVADIKTRVQHLDIAVAPDSEAANIVVRLLNQRDFAPALRAAFGKDRARKI